MNKTGEPLMMLHGIISDASFFDGIRAYLEDRFQVIAYDRRGYGRSNADAQQDFTVHTQAQDAATVLKQHTDAPAWVLGNSAGGLIAVELCLAHPELVKGMVLLEPSLIFDAESAALMDAWNAELNGYVEKKRIKKALPAFARVIGQPETAISSGDMETMKQTYKNLSAFMYGELNEVQRYRPSLEQVRQIRVPVTILATKEGKDSLFCRTSVAGAKTLGWPVVWVPGNHNAIKEKPKELADRIREIISAGNQV